MKKVTTTYQRQNGVPDRDSLSFAHPFYFPLWNSYRYPSRLFLGIELDNEYNKDKKQFRFTYRGMLYSITRKKALSVAVKANKYSLFPKQSSIPLEAFECSEITNPVVEWETYVNEEGYHVARIKGSNIQEEPTQLSLL